MSKYLTIAGSLALMFAVNANAALVVDTGAPDSLGFPLQLDANDKYAGQVSFSQDLTINSIQTYLNANEAVEGDTFTISLYQNASNGVGGLINTATATYAADGWNGINLLNWNVTAGTYWVGIEESTVGVVFSLPVSVANPLTHTAFTADGYLASYGVYDGLKFGLQIDATVAAVPETDTYAMLLTGLGIMGLVARRRNA